MTDMSMLSETEQNMAAAGVSPDAPAYEDYFGFEDTRRWFFPDGKQYIEFKVMTEGARSRYQSKTSRDVRLFKTTGDASLKIDPSEERKILLQESVVGWHMMKKDDAGKWFEAPFSINSKGGTEFEKWLDKANPKLINDLELTIRKANPWLQADMSVEEIDKEIENLKELRLEAVRRDEGK